MEPATAEEQTLLQEFEWLISFVWVVSGKQECFLEGPHPAEKETGAEELDRKQDQCSIETDLTLGKEHSAA